MKRLLVTTLVVVLSIHLLNAQKRIEVSDGIFVTFAVSPQYKLTKTTTTYTAKTQNCLFIALVQKKTIPNYVEYLKAKQTWTNAEIQKVENSFLDNAVKGHLDYPGNKGVVSAIKVGKYVGRNFSYSAINPTTGKTGKRFTQLFLVRNETITFVVWFFNNNKSANHEKDSFLNSIQIQ